MATALRPGRAAGADTAPPDLSDFVTAELNKNSVLIESEVILALRYPSECAFSGVQSDRYDAREMDAQFIEYQPPERPRAEPPPRKNLQRVSSPFSGRMTQQHAALNQREISVTPAVERKYLKEVRYALKMRTAGDITVGPFKVACASRGYQTPVRKVAVSPGDEILYKPVSLQPMGNASSGAPPAGPFPIQTQEAAPASPPAAGSAAPPPAANRGPPAPAKDAPPAPAPPRTASEDEGGRLVLFAAAAGILAALALLTAVVIPMMRKLPARSDDASSMGPRVSVPPISLPPAAQGPVAPPAGRSPGIPVLAPLPAGTAASGAASRAPSGKWGRIIAGKYEVHESIGSGGMGTVLLGLDSRLARKVAIKQMRSEIRSSPKECKRFIAEARIIAKLRHPYIVGIHDIEEEDGQVYLILDFVEGRSLASILGAKGRLTLPECKQLFLCICEAVDFAHLNKVLHRDLKPGNIMINNEGFAMVTDFGLAREAKDTICRLTQTDSSGSPAYMAPEQHLGECSRASDVYSLGVMFYEMATGRLPFPGPDFLSQKERLVYEEPSRVVCDLPLRCDQLVADALAADPAARPESAMAFYHRLKAV